MGFWDSMLSKSNRPDQVQVMGLRMPELPFIKAVEKGQALVLIDRYYGLLFKLPYFHHLTRVEKAEVKRIFQQVLMNIDIRLAHYNYDDIRVSENELSYVVDNLRHILALPELDKASYIIKFLLIAGLGKMKFLSKRNIDLVFVERETVMGWLKRDGRRKSFSLESVLFFHDRIAVSSESLLYSKNSEAVYYLGMTFARWARAKNMSLREVFMQQEAFGIETPPMGNSSLNAPMNMFIGSFLSSFFLPYNVSLDPMKTLFDKNHSHGLVDATMEDFTDFLSFFPWQSSFNGTKASHSAHSFSKFQEQFPRKKERFDDPFEKVYAELPSGVLNDDDESNGHLLFFKEKCFFLFCLLNGDEEKFFEVSNAITNNTKSFYRMSSQSTYDFLNMVKEYAEYEYFLPMSLLSALHGLDDVFVD